MGTEELKKTIGKLWGKKGEGGPVVSLGPESTFDAVLDLRLKELQRQIGEVKSRVNGLFFFVLGAAIVQVTLRLVA